MPSTLVWYDALDVLLTADQTVTGVNSSAATAEVEYRLWNNKGGSGASVSSGLRLIVESADDGLTAFKGVGHEYTDGQYKEIRILGGLGGLVIPGTPTPWQKVGGGTAFAVPVDVANDEGVRFGMRSFAPSATPGGEFDVRVRWQEQYALNLLDVVKLRDNVGAINVNALATDNILTWDTVERAGFGVVTIVSTSRITFSVASSWLITVVVNTDTAEVTTQNLEMRLRENGTTNLTARAVATVDGSVDQFGTHTIAQFVYEPDASDYIEVLFDRLPVGATAATPTRADLSYVTLQRFDLPR